MATVHGVENLVDVRRRTDDQAEITRPPQAKLEGPSVVRVGEPTGFDASTSRDPDRRTLNFRWRVQPLATSEGPTWKVAFPSPGFYRLALTVDNGRFADLAWRDLYAVREVHELGTEQQAATWDWIDPQSKVTFADDARQKLLGKSSLRADVRPYSGGRLALRCNLPGEPTRLTGKKALVFWLKTRNEHVPAWQDLNPLVELQSAAGQSLRLTPKRDFLSEPPYLEAREGWTYFSVPLAGDAAWTRAGDALESVSSIRLGFDSWGAPPLSIWIDGLGFE